MSISGSLLEQARTAILKAYSRDELRVQLRSGLREKLENIVPDADFTSQVDDLLDWAARHKREQELLDVLASGRPEDSDLRDIAAALRVRTLVADVPPSLPDEPSPTPQVSAKESAATAPPAAGQQRRAVLRGEIVLSLLALVVTSVGLVFGDNLFERFQAQWRSPTSELRPTPTVGLEQPTSAPTPVTPTKTPVVTALPAPVDSASPKGEPPGATLATQKTAAQLFESGIDLSAAKNWTEAIDMFSQAIQAGYDPAWIAHFELGNAYSALAAAPGNDPATRRALYRSALDAFNNVLAASTGRINDSQYGELCLKRARAHAELDQNEEAVTAFECATSHNAQLTSRDHEILGMVLMELGRYDDAVPHLLERAATAELARDRATAYLQAAQAESKKPDRSNGKVIEYLILATEADSTFSAPYASLGMAYEGSGDREAACDAYLDYAERVDVLTDPVKTHLKQLQCTR